MCRERCQNQHPEGFAVQIGQVRQGDSKDERTLCAVFGNEPKARLKQQYFLMGSLSVATKDGT